MRGRGGEEGRGGDYHGDGVRSRKRRGVSMAPHRGLSIVSTPTAQSPEITRRRYKTAEMHRRYRTGRQAGRRYRYRLIIYSGRRRRIYNRETAVFALNGPSMINSPEFHAPDSSAPPPPPMPQKHQAICPPCHTQDPQDPPPPIPIPIPIPIPPPTTAPSSSSPSQS